MGYPFADSGMGALQVDLRRWGQSREDMTIRDIHRRALWTRLLAANALVASVLVSVARVVRMLEEAEITPGP